MAVISVIITQSAEQVVSGIPRSISITTNIPSIIFYTLDGSTPTLSSNQYVSPIILSTSNLNVVLKVLASDGVDSSPVITETYITNITDNARLSHSATTAPAQSNLASLYPYGNSPIQPNANFLNSAEAGITVNNPALPSAPTAFDSSGNPSGLTNQPYNSLNYSIKYPTKDHQNAPNIGVGVFPENTTIYPDEPVPEQSNQYSNMFDPRAFVIFQDSTKENPNDPPMINRANFSLEDPKVARDGNALFTSGLDAPPTSGSFVRYEYNPRTNMMTYYYLDTWTNRWIISTSPYTPNGTWDGNMAGVASAGRSIGSRYVHAWQPFQRRILF